MGGHYLACLRNLCRPTHVKKTNSARYLLQLRLPDNCTRRLFVSNMAHMKARQQLVADVQSETTTLHKRAEVSARCHNHHLALSFWSWADIRVPRATACCVCDRAVLA